MSVLQVVWKVLQQYQLNQVLSYSYCEHTHSMIAFTVIPTLDQFYPICKIKIVLRQMLLGLLQKVLLSLLQKVLLSLPQKMMLLDPLSGLSVTLFCTLHDPIHAV